MGIAQANTRPKQRFFVNALPARLMYASKLNLISLLNVKEKVNSAIKRDANRDKSASLI